MKIGGLRLLTVVLALSAAVGTAETLQDVMKRRNLTQQDVL